MTRRWLSLSLTWPALLTSCMEAPRDGELGVVERASSTCVETCAQPVVRDWSLRDPAVRIWPRETRRAVLVLHDATPTTFRAYGVDLDTDSVVFVFDVPDGDAGELSAINSDEWELMHAELATSAGNGVLGSSKQPPPRPPSPDPPDPDPVGDELSPGWAKAVKRAAHGLAAHADAMSGL